MKVFVATAIGSLLMGSLAACGGGSVGSGTSSGNGNGNGSGAGGTCTSGAAGTNIQTICVSPGPNNDYVNGLFTSVTVCTPATSACQTIDNILVDTGSYGLRLVRTLVTVALPAQTNATGGKIGECTTFADGYSWGQVVTADVRLANETASSVPIQLIGTSGFFAVPSACSQGGGTEEDDSTSLGVNGILGIGVLAQDCGPTCTTQSGAENIAQYFACSNATPNCATTVEAISSQVANPVAYFAADNNGVQIQLPSIDASGATSVTGAVIFGIGTQSNNARGSSATVLDTDGNGDISASFGGTSYASFIDSGSNGLFFPSTTIPDCSGSASDFYCPTSTVTESAQISGSNGTSKAVSFSVANALSLINSINIAFDDLAGDGTGNGDLSGSFDFGLPFFYGRNIYFGLYNQATATGEPYYAY